MSNLEHFFVRMCTAVEAFQSLPKSLQRKASVRDAGAETVAQTIALVPELIKAGKIHDGLLSAMKSNSIDLVKAFPEVPYGTYKVLQDERSLEFFARDIDPDILHALCARGLSTDRFDAPLLKRAFRQKDERMRKWALDFLAVKPGEFRWLYSLDRHHLSRQPEFAAALVSKAVKSSPTGASNALEKNAEYSNGLHVALLLHAGVKLPSHASQRARDKLKGLSNHAKLQIMRKSLADFTSDDEAVKAARDLF